LQRLYVSSRAKLNAIHTPHYIKEYFITRISQIEHDVIRRGGRPLK